MLRMRTTALILISGILSGCARSSSDPAAVQQPTLPVQPKPTPSGPSPTAPSSSPGGALSSGPQMCPDVQIELCKANGPSISVSKLLTMAGGTSVTLRATVTLGETACTSSVPASCSTTLTVVEPSASPPTHATDAATSATLGGVRCGGPTGCCALAVGETYLITGAHSTRPGWANSADMHEVQVTSVCRPSPTDLP